MFPNMKKLDVLNKKKNSKKIVENSFLLANFITIFQQVANFHTSPHKFEK